MFKNQQEQTDSVGGTNYTVSLREMMERVKTEPPQKMIYSGIKENSVGFIFGPSKSGKTTFCENLALSIASGQFEYLGKPINSTNRKVLFLSLEEFYSGRTNRNIKQVEAITTHVSGDTWIDNYIVATNNIPRYVTEKEDWKIISNEIKKHAPGLVIIDSASRLHNGPIEDSTEAKLLMKQLRELALDVSTTIIVIHHTPKLYNMPLSIYALAGSRILAQEADFMIGINKTLDGKIYLKEVAFRYAPEDCETVSLLQMDDHQWFSVIGKADEASLLSAFDGRKDEHNKAAIFEYIQERNANGGAVVTTEELFTLFVESKVCSKDTLHKALNSLVAEKKIQKPQKGHYKMPA
ncbi:MAG: AAA family ATPase [Bacteroidetes bacterium]|nr:AAA family ATPase [Bacteroidota bacterium]